MERTIWNFLVNNHFTVYAAAGIMGNLHAESGLRPDNVEDSSGHADSTYTQKVDNGTYPNFANDRIGYGIAQWTDPGRKAKFYSFMKQRGLSIADLNGQLEYLIYELMTDFPSLYADLLNAHSVNEASDAFLIKFENPYDKSDNVKRKRAAQGFIYFNRYSTPNPAGFITTTTATSTLRKGDKGNQVE